MKPGQLPDIFQHQLAHKDGLKLTPQGLIDAIKAGQALGYPNIIVVPATFDPSLTADTAADIALEHNAKLQACGFLGYSAGFDMFDDGDGLKRAEDEFLRQFRFALAFRRRGCGGNLFSGPFDQPWKGGVFNYDAYCNWLKFCNAVLLSEDMLGAIEALNELESCVPNAFNTLGEAINDIGAKNLGFQFDSGHAHLRMGHADAMGMFEKMARKIYLFEFANVGRHPLSRGKGIKFDGYFRRLDMLPKNCLISVEPFDPKGVILPLSLQSLNNTKTDGIECLRLDAEFLRKKGVMAMAA